MGIVEYELNRLKQQEIEVRALVALAQGRNKVIAFKATEKLEEYAFPEKLADKINQQPLDMYDEEF
jgi:hypothetical protein